MNSNIVVENLSKTYGTIQALAPFSAQFAGGEVTCILGPSGCGKTTFLRLLLGLDKPTQGRIVGLEGPVTASFQEDRLLSGMSALRNLLLCCRGSGEQLKSQLRQVGLTEEELSRPVQELSGGMRRRVAVVRALAAPSRLIILDEPFQGLDPKSWQVVVEYLLAARQGRTMLVVTHNPEDVEAMGAGMVEMS